MSTCIPSFMTLASQFKEAIDANDLEQVKHLVTEHSLDSATKTTTTTTTTAAAAASAPPALTLATLIVNDEHGNTALHEACIKGHLAIVKYLVETCTSSTSTGTGNAHSSDVNSKFVDVPNAKDKTAVHFSIVHGRLIILQYLVETCGATIKPSALYNACSVGKDVNVVQYLVETCRLDVTTLFNKHNTCLHVACFRGHLAVVQYLVEKTGAHANAHNVKGDTPLMLAILGERLEVVHYLVQVKNNDKTLDIEAVNKEGETALFKACRDGGLAMLQCLVEVGRANLAAKSAQYNRYTILHQACLGGDLAIVQYLVESCHVNVDSVDRFRWTPLHVASCNGLLDIVQYLVETGHANVQHVNDCNFTAWDEARQMGQQAVMTYLQDKMGQQQPNMEPLGTCLVLSSDGTGNVLTDDGDGAVSTSGTGRVLRDNDDDNVEPL